MNSRIITCTWMLLMTMICSPRMMAQAYDHLDIPNDNCLITVKYQGTRPTITDFVTAYLNFKKEETFFDKVYKEWNLYLQKKSLSPTVSISNDVKNGYMRYDLIRPEGNDTLFMEMCFWNCADGKHKLVAANVVWLSEGDYGWTDYIGTHFLLYDNKTRIMRSVYPEDIGALYEGDGLSVFFLPRKGKNIRVSAAGGGDRWNEVLIWDGYRFSSKKVD